MSGEVAGLDRERGRLDRADRLRLGAAGVEEAARRRVDRRRDVAGEDDAVRRAGAIRVGDHRRREQRHGVGMARRAEEIPNRGHLDDLPQVHDRHPVAHVLDDGEVVGDEEVGEAELALQVLEEVDDLGLDRDVQGRHRLVADDQRRPEGQRAGNPDALALAAREFRGEAVVVLRVEPDHLHQLLDLPLAPGAVGHVVDGQGVADDGAHPAPGVEGSVGILEDHLHLAPVAPELPTGKGADVGPVQHHPPRGEGVQPGDAAGERRLTAAGLADQSQRFPARHLEAHPLDGVNLPDLPLEDDPAADRKALDHVLDAQQRLGGGPRRRRGRRPHSRGCGGERVRHEPRHL